MRPTIPAFEFCCVGNCFLPIDALFAPADGHGIRTPQVLQLFDSPPYGQQDLVVGFFLPCLDDLDFRARSINRRASHVANAAPKERATFKVLVFCIELVQ